MFPFKAKWVEKRFRLNFILKGSVFWIRVKKIRKGPISARTALILVRKGPLSDARHNQLCRKLQKMDSSDARQLRERRAKFPDL